jgi:hypothetical protein
MIYADYYIVKNGQNITFLNLVKKQFLRAKIEKSPLTKKQPFHSIEHEEKIKLAFLLTLAMTPLLPHCLCLPHRKKKRIREFYGGSGQA